MAKITSVPRDISDRAKQIYRDLVRNNKHLLDTDRDLLSQYCSVLARIENISRELDSSELMVSVGGDRKQRSPYIGLLAQQQSIALALADKLILTPKSRNQADIKNEKPEQEDPFARAMNDIFNDLGEDDDE
ncbi:P27 family phage terminase small subunit [Shewanella sp. SE1]|uniref:P27 family phage terminase small subunit n=1 Tax=Shewanella sp. SE1 TaxID=2705014 RepID=UPI00138F3104|nr:P27 family phage terminase small subunit [Shewanella sp. SE1]NDO73063.1 P27 family phage terminase small subunit [Shewanella sp. SE1]